MSKFITIKYQLKDIYCIACGKILNKFEWENSFPEQFDTTCKNCGVKITINIHEAIDPERKHTNDCLIYIR
ncbi:hypothetical protein LCGC14_0560110 [marine sediment metagenome]|uniref:Uncharacterized protein n=1 Tax=marine sediment metagenome TaxID=412755 RepID=A0A0F9RSD0_9ZZZZ